MPDERPVNTSPNQSNNYEWEFDEELGLIIYSECCADRFSKDMQWELFLELQRYYRRIRWID